MRQKLLLLLLLMGMCISPTHAMIELTYDKDQGKVIIKNDQLVIDGVTYKFIIDTYELENLGMTEVASKIYIWEAHFEAIGYDDDKATDVALKRRFIANSDRVVYNKDESPITITCNELSVQYKSKDVIFPVTKYATDMFKGKTKMKSLILPDTPMEIPYQAFYGATSLEKLTIQNTITWIGAGAFDGCENLKEIIGMEHIKTDNVTDMHYMFSGCSSLTSLDVSGFKTDNVKYMIGMFSGCSSLTSLDVSGFKTDNVTDMGSMFSGCESLTSLDVSGFKTENVIYMYDMFKGCSGLTSLDVSGFNTENVTSMYEMFSGCSGLTSLDLSGFKTDNVKYMGRMFYGCESLTSLDVSGFKTDNVTSMSWMFRDCSSLTSLDLSGFKTDKVTDMSCMFYKCSSLTTIYAGSGWSTESVTDGHSMFYGCKSLVGGKGTAYDASHTDHEYAHIDGGAALPGYFTQGVEKPDAPGDLNGDNVTDVGDIMAIINFMAAPLGEAGGFDLNGDGSVDVGDIMAIINIMAQ